MKNNLFVFVALLLCTGISAQNNVDTAKEKEAVKKLITESTNAYRARDFSRIAETFVHDESVIKTGASKNGYMVRTGWEEIASNYKNTFKNNPDPIVRKLEKTNFKIKVYKESAWAIHDEIQDGANGQINKQIIVHFLEKHDNQWKIVFMSQIFASSYDAAE